MAIYHLEAKIVSRGAGRSAVAAAAYLSCSRMLNEYDGVQHDYTRKQGLGWRQVFLPATAPAEWQDRETLWNAVEETETAKDSRLAREFVAALPIELSREEQIQLLQDFIKEQFVADGMCADAAIHDPYPPGHNPHAHILLTVRPLDEKGKWQYKTEKEYLCVKDGEERGFTAAEFKQAQADGWEKQYQYKVGKKKVYMTPSAAQAQGYERIAAAIEVVGILLVGSLCYWCRRKWIHLLLVFVCIVGVSIPPFFLASSFLDVFAVRFGWISVASSTGLMRYLPAAICLALGGIALYSQLLSQNIEREMNEDYAMYARCRGLSDMRILWTHALPHALAGLAPSFLQMVGISLAGSAIVEKIFSLPGLGYSIVDSVLYRDTPMIHATILFLAFFLVICNTVSDILQRIFQRGHAEGVAQ